MSGEVEKCPILHVCPKFDVFTLYIRFHIPSNSAFPTPTIIIDIGNDEA